LLHPFAGVLSAYGMGLASVRAIRQATLALPLDPSNDAAMADRIATLRAEAVADLCHLPEALRGSWLLADAAIERYRIFASLIGLLVFSGLAFTLSRTKLGLLIRAGVQDRSMVQALGYRIDRLFVAVFVAGSALAGLGGVLWGFYQQSVTAQIGAQVNVLIFIVIIIGGLGSTLGCFVGALLVGLIANYAGFLEPKIALFSNIGLMVAVLLWRPQGLYPVSDR
ncbi:MAG: hypothetical protein EBX64_06575, partial [Betaproteobacteria bacterium]|nr:hypothetical protein [Betaproteobacteria bacterium]